MNDRLPPEEEMERYVRERIAAVSDPDLRQTQQDAIDAIKPHLKRLQRNSAYFRAEARACELYAWQALLDAFIAGAQYEAQRLNKVLNG